MIWISHPQNFFFNHNGLEISFHISSHHMCIHWDAVKMELKIHCNCDERCKTNPTTLWMNDESAIGPQLFSLTISSSLFTLLIKHCTEALMSDAGNIDRHPRWFVQVLQRRKLSNTFENLICTSQAIVPRSRLYRLNSISFSSSVHHRTHSSLAWLARSKTNAKFKSFFVESDNVGSQRDSGFVHKRLLIVLYCGGKSWYKAISHI